MQERLGITSAQGIYNRVAEGLLPASWYFVCRELADESGVECPVHFFAFKQSTIGGLLGAEGQEPISAYVQKDSEQSQNATESHTGGVS